MCSKLKIGVVTHTALDVLGVDEGSLLLVQDIRSDETDILYGAIYDQPVKPVEEMTVRVPRLWGNGGELLPEIELPFGLKAEMYYRDGEYPEYFPEENIMTPEQLVRVAFP